MIRKNISIYLHNKHKQTTMSTKTVNNQDIADLAKFQRLLRNIEDMRRGAAQTLVKRENEGMFKRISERRRNAV